MLFGAYHQQKENEPKLRSPENDKNIFYDTKDI